MLCLASLYSSAHDVSAEQSPMRLPAHVLEEASPVLGSTTPDSGNNRRTSKRAAENVQRALIKSICPLLPDFVVSCDIAQMMQVCVFFGLSIPHISIYTHTHTFTCVFTYTYVCLCIYIYTYIHIHMCMYMYVYMYVCVYIYIYIYIYIESK